MYKTFDFKWLVRQSYIGKWEKVDNYRWSNIDIGRGKFKGNLKYINCATTLCRYLWVLMEGVAAGVGLGAAEDVSSTTLFSRLSHAVSRRYQHLLDRCTPYIFYRWIACFFIASIYVLRVYLIEGFYIVSYGLGIYILNLLIGFLSPQVDPEILDLNEGPALPVRESDEFRPFVRRLPEFKFWYSITKAFCIAFLMTFFNAFDVPVFWPILLFYWVVLFTLTMRRQISHMIKYKYVPFSFGKQRYDGKVAAPSDTKSLLKD